MEELKQFEFDGGKKMICNLRKIYPSIIVILAVCALLFLQGCGGKNLTFDNASFYNDDGTFNVDAGKDAYIKMMEFHGYPIFPGLRENMWVSDYGLGQFSKLGLGAYTFINEVDGDYMGQDLYLLPGQMLPEHYHLQTDKASPKMEGWHVRHGVSYVYGEGVPAKNMYAVVPKCHMNGTVSVKHEVVLHQGQATILDRATARHWQFGGPEGAVISEYATYHDNDGVRHSDPKIRFP
ncbi:MAG: cupin domain-containing protein [Planctomycetota bacterium]|jgi:D-lyxose ketol-isomerase